MDASTKEKKQAKALAEFAKDVRFWITVIMTGLASMGVSQVGTSGVAQDVSVATSVTAKALNDHAVHISDLAGRLAKVASEHEQAKETIKSLQERVDLLEKAVASRKDPQKVFQIVTRLNEMKSAPHVVAQESISSTPSPMTVPTTLEEMKSR
jgi:hypothetical protein